MSHIKAQKARPSGPPGGASLLVNRNDVRPRYAGPKDETSRPSVMTAVRHLVRFCASLGITPFRPQVANDWDGKVTEEVIMMLFLEHLLFVVKVRVRPQKDIPA